MQRRSNIKFNSAGIAGCASLCCLLFLMIGLAVPLSTSAVYANDINYDSEISPTAEGVCGEDLQCEISKVTIGLTPSGSVTSSPIVPTDGSGRKGYVSLKANVKVESSAGYRVFIGSNSKYLTNGDDNEHKIESIESDKLYNDIDLNHWGYTSTVGSSIDAENATYHPIPSVLGGAVDDVEGKTLTEGSNGTNGKDYTIAFAANIGAGMPSGTYSNQMTFSVVSDPLQTSKAHNDFDITTMQEMNNKDSQSKNACARAEIGATGQLKDERDGKYYWVTKLRDGNCWMTQNLDLDIKTSDGKLGDNTGLQEGVWPDAAKTDYSSAPNIKIYATSTKVINDTTTNNDPPYTASWSLGDYRMNYTNTTVRDNGADCGGGKADASECTTQTNAAFVAYTTPTSADGETDAHYILGNHYQWTVATANTTNGTASICPKGWKLPPNTGVGSFATLITPGADNITSVSTLVQDPYYFVRGGIVFQGSNLFYFAGSYGYYWSSTPSDSNAYSLLFNAGASISPSSGPNGQYFGFSVRCLAR